MSDVSRQVSRVTRSDTYGRVAVKKENQFQMCLESLMGFKFVKNTNVNKIGETYLIIRGVFKTVINGSELRVRSVRRT